MQLREHPGVVSKREWYTVDPRQLMVIPGFNVRDLTTPEAREKLDELKDSVRRRGVETPLEIRIVDETLVITKGHRRHKVVMELIDEGMDFRAIPVIPEPKALTDVDRFVRAMHSDDLGEPLTVLEKAEMVRRLLNVFGWTKEQVAEEIGVKSLAMVDRYLEASALPAEVKEAVQTGEVSITTAVNLVRDAGSAAAPVALAAARTTARASGRKRVTPASVTRTKPKRERPAKGANGAATPSPPPAPSQIARMGNIAKVDRAIAMLREVINDNYDPERAVGNMLQRAFDLTRVYEWLGKVVELVEAREAAGAKEGASAH